MRELDAEKPLLCEVLPQFFVRRASAKHKANPAHLVGRHVSIRAVEIRRPVSRSAIGPLPSTAFFSVVARSSPICMPYCSVLCASLREQIAAMA